MKIDLLSEPAHADQLVGDVTPIGTVNGQPVNSVDNSIALLVEDSVLHGTSDEKPAGLLDDKGQIRTASDNIPGLDEFFESGGVVVPIPREKANSRKFEPRQSSTAKAGRTSEYERVRVPKGEALSNRLTMASPDWTSIGGGGSQRDRVTPEQIHGALANSGLSEHEEAFLVYVFTEEARYRTKAKSLLLERASHFAIHEKWNIRKPGIFPAMCETILDNYLRPENFKNLSTREWAKHLGLSCNKDWSNRWRFRYSTLMDYGNQLLERGQEILARNF